MKNHYELAKENFESKVRFSLEKKKTITLPLFVWRALECELQSCIDVSSCRIDDCLKDLESDNLEIREGAKWILYHEIELQYSYNLLKQKLKDVL